jgi:hypothetical protein
VFHIPSATFTTGVLTNGPAHNGQDSFVINEFIKLKGLVTHYKSSSNPILAGDVANGAIWLWWISSATDNAIAVTDQCRYRFDDS